MGLFSLIVFGVGGSFLVVLVVVIVFGLVIFCCLVSFEGTRLWAGVVV